MSLEIYSKNIPRATYRLQFNEHFRLADALGLVPYFRALGVSHVYASPPFKARAHSAHGYDVCDFSRLNPEIGTEADMETFVTALHENGMGLVIDIVPNHMGIGTPENSWWWDVLKNGRESKYANHFDVNWESSNPALRGKILVPILDDYYQNTLDRGELQLQVKNGGTVLKYYENKFPIAPNTISETGPAEQLNSNPTALDELIQKQNYRLASWREGDEQLNYRRFFAVNTLAALRVEDEIVFDETHSLIKKWLGRQWVDGLRVDHPDGLREPQSYLAQLRTLAPHSWIVVEKILQPREELPGDWPVQGTTGYDFLNRVNGLFIQSENQKAFTDFYHEFTGEATNIGAIVLGKKRLVLKTLFVTEVNRLTDLLVQIVTSYSHLNFCRVQVREALIELAASFPVYRTYARPAEKFISKNDSIAITQAASQASMQRRDLPPELFKFLNTLLSLDWDALQRVQASQMTSPVELEGEFVARFQQLTGPIMAKGVEDTTFYCANWFASMNEVGGDPGTFGVSIEEFHEFCRQQQMHWPYSMLCSSTHDTKRSEDVRARVNLLSEIPGDWHAAVLRWSKMNERHRMNNLPDRNMEYLLYQTLVGVWPISLERILAYMEKASCEAKQHTDWNDRDSEYDKALRKFVTATLADKNFVTDLERFISSAAEASQILSLAQTLIKLTAPGVPDIYQGNELWDFSLVDPDNRRPVDFEIRRQFLAEAKDVSADKVWQRRDNGLPKLWLIQKALALRARVTRLFEGDYEPLVARGEKTNHVVAFMRGGGVITIVPRFVLELKGDWKGTILELPEGNWSNEFTGESFAGEIDVAGLFKIFPVALLVEGG